MSEVDWITAWVMTAILCLHQYDEMLANEWRGADAGKLTYAAYRKQVYDRFLAEAIQGLAPDFQQGWNGCIQAAEAQDPPAYQQQMSILAELDILRTAPILFNADPHPLDRVMPGSAQGKKIPLSELRQTKRGIGDYPLTIFDTRMRR